LAAINNKLTVIVAQKKNKAMIQLKNFLTGEGFISISLLSEPESMS
jgi:hypothetical protein